MEDVKIKTGFGGLCKLDLEEGGLASVSSWKVADWIHVGRLSREHPVTLVSLSLILSLTIYEFVDYRRVHMVSLSPRERASTTTTHWDEDLAPSRREADIFCAVLGAVGTIYCGRQVERRETGGESER